jgi:hypothetical protein
MVLIYLALLKTAHKHQECIGTIALPVPARSQAKMLRNYAI